MTALTPQKTQTRRQIRARLRDLGPEYRHAASQRIQERLLPHLVGPNVLLYAWFRTEVQLDRLIDHLITEYGSCLLPRVDEDDLRIHRITDLSRDVSVSAWGIREPVAQCPIVDSSALSQVILPGLAFDIRGNRLGRGRGYYDRLLAQMRDDTSRCAVAFDAQIVEEVPVERHDLPIDIIVSESGILRREQKKIRGQ